MYGLHGFPWFPQTRSIWTVDVHRCGVDDVTQKALRARAKETGEDPDPELVFGSGKLQSGPMSGSSDISVHSFDKLKLEASKLSQDMVQAKCNIVAVLKTLYPLPTRSSLADNYIFQHISETEIRFKEESRATDLDKRRKRPRRNPTFT
jgi:hypothetical protein